MIGSAAKNYDISATNLSVLYNYFDGSIKLFSDLYLIKFLYTLEKFIFMYFIYFSEKSTFHVYIQLAFELLIIE